VYQSVADVQRKTFTVDPGTTNLGFAQDCPTLAGCTPAESARISFGTLGTDSTVQVTYRLELGGGRILTGQVHPRLYPAPGFCG
jgi:hypothetical protein